MSAKIARANEIASDHLNQIAMLFKEGAKLTLIVRTPGNDEADFCLTNDELREAIKVLERREAAETTIPKRFYGQS